jgi:hypothetical protein
MPIKKDISLEEIYNNFKNGGSLTYEKLDKMSLSNTIFEILEMTDLAQKTKLINKHPIPPTTEGTESIEELKRLHDLEWLENEGIIKCNLDQDTYESQIVISILNRYKLELIYNTAYSEIDPDYKPGNIPSLVYYDSIAGKGMLNGLDFKLRGKNKAMFDVLASQPKEWVSKETVRIQVDKVRSKKKGPGKVGYIGVGVANKKGRDTLNKNVTNLRNACRANPIIIRQKMENLMLDATVIPYVHSDREETAKVLV